MGVNKVDLSTGETLIDISNDTVTPETLAEGATAHNAQGELIIGAMAGGGGAGGIIDVTELPTSNIDTNAVYRVTENVQTEKTGIYLRAYLNGQNMVITVQQYLAFQGIPTVPNIYVVDELSNMKATDTQYFTEVNLYILRSDGICYVALANGAIITLGLFGFEKTGYDKGFTENAYEETEYGVYTTIEAYKEVIRYFVRKGGEWEEISATMSEILPNGFNSVDVLSGLYSANKVTMLQNGASLNVRDLIINEKAIPSKVTVDVPCTSDLIVQGGNISNISKEYFRRKDGSFISSIGSYAFAYRQNIVSVDMPDTITDIYDKAFDACVSLSEISFPESVRYMGSNVFKSCTGLRSVSLPSKLKVINDSLFNSCSKLASITLPQELSIISMFAFRYCEALESVVFPENLTEIKSEAFEGCKSLKNITFPASVESIGETVFNGCTLNSIVFKGKPTDLSGVAFLNCGVRIIRCPWAEGEVAGAPWAANDAVIIYSDYNSDPNKNLVPTSIDEWRDIYNGVGYKNGLKFETDLFEPFDKAEDYTVTGYITALSGDVFRISGVDWTNADDNYIALYDSDFGNIGAYVLDGNSVAESGISYDGNVAVFDTLKVTDCDLSEMMYIRLSCKANGADVIVNRDGAIAPPSP